MGKLLRQMDVLDNEIAESDKVIAVKENAIEDVEKSITAEENNLVISQRYLDQINILTSSIDQMKNLDNELNRNYEEISKLNLNGQELAEKKDAIENNLENAKSKVSELNISLDMHKSVYSHYFTNNIPKVEQPESDLDLLRKNYMHNLQDINTRL